jgi:hypothetical protein
MKGEAMTRTTRLTAALVAAGALAAVSAGNALAQPAGQADFGQHVAACAQLHLGQRADPPQVTCGHDGTAMTFPTFGAMVLHMLEMHR